MKKMSIFIAFFFVLFSLFCLNQAATTPCEEDWIYNDGFCYWSSYNLLNKNHSAIPIANWYGAQLHCLTLGADLVYFNNTFQKRLISTLVACSSSWLGLIYKRGPDYNGWAWWGTCNEGDHIVTKYETTCASHIPTAARLDSDGTVTADFPDNRYPFVCIKPSDPVDTSCFMPVPTQEEEDERNLVAKICNRTVEAVYESSGEGDGVNAVDDLCTKSMMKSSVRVCNKDCMSTGFLDDDSPCCAKVPIGKASKRFYQKETDKCYYLPTEKVLVDYFAAQLACQERNMHLISIHSRQENQVIGMLSMCHDHWIGLENVDPKKVCNCSGWAWEDFTSGKFDRSLCGDFYNNWFDGAITPKHPLCSQNAQCAFMHTETGKEKNRLLWKNCYCYEMYEYICVE